MGLLQLIDNYNYNSDMKVTVLANKYVIFEEKVESCQGRFKVFDFDGRELILKTTLDTSQEIITLDKLIEKVKNLSSGGGTACALCGSTYYYLTYGSSQHAINLLVAANTHASGKNSTALGESTLAKGNWSTAMGLGTIAHGDYSIAMGNSSQAFGSISFAMGHQAKASGDYSTAIGFGAEAKGNNSFTIGTNSHAYSEYSIALGGGNSSYDINSIVIGRNSQAAGQSATAIGEQAKAKANYSTAIGYKTIANASYSTAIGSNIQVNNVNTLGNGGPIYGEELYSKKFIGSGIVGTHSGDYNDLNNLSIQYSKNNKHYYTISGPDPSGRYFDSNMVEDNTTVNITQLVYTLVGRVQQLNKKLENQQSTIEVLNTRLNALEST